MTRVIERFELTFGTIGVLVAFTATRLATKEQNSTQNNSVWTSDTINALTVQGCLNLQWVIVISVETFFRSFSINRKGPQKWTLFGSGSLCWHYRRYAASCFEILSQQTKCKWIYFSQIMKISFIFSSSIYNSGGSYRHATNWFHFNTNARFYARWLAVFLKISLKTQIHSSPALAGQKLSDEHPALDWKKSKYY